MIVLVVNVKRRPLRARATLPSIKPTVEEGELDSGLNVILLVANPTLETSSVRVCGLHLD